MLAQDLPYWPYPRWIAHRGAGKLAPENTLAAFRLGASFGYRMFECDVKLSRDGVPFLLHDSSITRTTEGLGRSRGSSVAGELGWNQLSRLDAGSWHSRQYAGEPLATLAAVAAFCLRNRHAINLEIKPTPGTEGKTGEVVAQHAARLWQDAPVAPLLSSFDIPALEAARSAAPALPRGLLLDSLQDQPWEHWLQQARTLGCLALICNYRLWDAQTVAQAQGAGLRTLSYTVNDASVAHSLLALGTDGVITDRVDLFSPN